VSVTLIIEQAKLMRRIILSSSAACPAIPNFSTLSHKRHDFQEKVIENKMCVLIFSTALSEKYFIRSRNEQDMVLNVY
jgi:hypothetical protein